MRWRKLILVRKDDDGSASTTEVIAPDERTARQLRDAGTNALHAAFWKIRRELLDAAELQLGAIEAALQARLKRAFPEQVRTQWLEERRLRAITPRSAAERVTELVLTGEEPALAGIASLFDGSEIDPADLGRDLRAACQLNERTRSVIAALAATKNVLHRRDEFERFWQQPLGPASRFLTEERVRDGRLLAITPHVVELFEAIATELVEASEADSP